MNIGILGSSFDPPHIGHLLVARQTREVVGLDQVWLMPYFAHSWDTVIAGPGDRLAMAEFLEEQGIVVSSQEMEHREKSYTIDTIRRLKTRYPHTFSWIVGSDILTEFNKWKEPEALARETTLFVFPRNGYPLPGALPDGFRAVSSPDLVTTNISSTVVRNRLVKGLSVTGLIPDKVLAYIQKRHLYSQ